MERIKLDLKDSVYELCKIHPDIIDILINLGFKDIIKPGMLQTAGRVMTIPKGAASKKIDMEVIRQAFLEKGYEV